MTASKKYKHFFTAFLVALYAFAAMPIQLWHHHRLSANCVRAAGHNGYIIQQQGKTTDSNCPICSHQYSVYNDDALLVTIAPVIVIGAVATYSSLAIPFSSAWNLFNKGPPLFS